MSSHPLLRPLLKGLPKPLLPQVLMRPLVALELDFVGNSFKVGDGVSPLQPSTLTALVSNTRNSVATDYDATGKLVTFAANVLRAQAYDPYTHEKLGLRTEEASTNLCKNSATLSDWTWRGGMDVNQGERKFIDGTTNWLWLISLDGYPEEQSVLEIRHTVPAGTQSIAASFFAAPSGTSQDSGMVGLTLASTTYAGINIVWSTTTGAVLFSDWDGALWKNVEIGAQRTIDGFRFWVTADAPGGFNGNQVVTAIGAACEAGIDWDQNGMTGAGEVDVHVMGFQLEARRYPSSYIKTTGAAGTREADIVQLKALAPWFNQSEGTWLTESRSAFPSSTHASNTLSMSDGTTANEVTLGLVTAGATSQMTARVGGVQQAAAGPSYTRDSRLKLAGRYRTSDYALSANGQACSKITNSGVPPSISLVRICGCNTGVRIWNGTQARIVYYPQGKTDQELQLLSG
ncbi:hypothetical protein D3C76_47690 [compost metagenome]